MAADVIGGVMFRTLVVALDLEDDGDRALPIVRTLAGSARSPSTS